MPGMFGGMGNPAAAEIVHHSWRAVGVLIRKAKEKREKASNALNSLISLNSDTFLKMPYLCPRNWAQQPFGDY